MSCTDSKVEAMFKLLLDSEEKDQDKKQKVLAEKEEVRMLLGDGVGKVFCIS